MTRKDASPTITFVLTEPESARKVQGAKRGNDKGCNRNETETFEQFTVTRMEFQPLIVARSWLEGKVHYSVGNSLRFKQMHFLLVSQIFSCFSFSSLLNGFLENHPGGIGEKGNSLESTGG